jgi:pyruvate dehydrogenase E2 component (dihydrolipoamide acetyltransferase)
MPTNILMPALSPTMEKGNLAKWLKKEGDTIKSGDVIAEIETDKATMEVEAVDEGVLAKIVVPEGTADVAVNEVIAVLAGEGEDAKSISAPAAGGAAPAKAEAPKAELRPPPRPAPAAAAPRGSGPAGGSRAFASPLARRIAKDAGLDLNAIKGSGPHGRIVEKDVEAAKKGGGAKAAPAAAAGSGRCRGCAARERSLGRAGQEAVRAGLRESRMTACARRSRAA